MADKNTKAKDETKPKRKVRTIEERIAELQAKADERRAKAKAKAEAELTKAIAVRDNARARLERAEAKVAALRETAGLEAEVDGDVEQG